MTKPHYRWSWERKRAELVPLTARQLLEIQRLKHGKPYESGGGRLAGIPRNEPIY